MALTESKNRYVRRPEFIIERHMTVAAGKEIFEGAIVEIASGYAQPASGSGLCMGIAAEHKEAGEEVRIQYGQIEVLPIASALETSNGAQVYASADDAVSYTPGTTIVGKQVGVVPTTTITNSDTLIYVQMCLND